MADPVATVEKIVKIGLKIKAAVDTVRHNQEECQEIRKRVLRFSAILSQLQQTGMMNDSPAMSGALEDLEESLQHALELVTACQETSTLRRLITAGDLSKQLRRVKDDILNKVMLASFAINTHTTIVLLTIQAGGHHPHPPPRQPEDAAAGISHSSQSTDDARSELNDVQTNLLAGNEGSIAVGIRKFRWSELKAATNGFSNHNRIGYGGTFNVYKTRLFRRPRKSSPWRLTRTASCPCMTEPEAWSTHADHLRIPASSTVPALHPRSAGDAPRLRCSCVEILVRYRRLTSRDGARRGSRSASSLASSSAGDAGDSMNNRRDRALPAELRAKLLRRPP